MIAGIVVGVSVGAGVWLWRSFSKFADEWDEFLRNERED